LLKLFPPDRPHLNVGVLCGEASDRLAVVDCDCLSSFQRMMDALCDPETIVVRTHRGGHIYLRTPVTVRSRGMIEKVEIKADGNYVLAPGSLHPRGVRYEFIKRADRILELDTLAPIPELRFESAPIRPSWFPVTAWRLITGKSVRKVYPSRSEREHAACMSLVNRGYDFEQIMGFFIEYADGSSKFRQLYAEDPKNAERWLRLSYDKATRYVSSNLSEERAIIGELREKALSVPWPGRTGLSDRATYLAHLEIADRCGKIVYGASVRELAELAGLTKDTVSHANQRLLKTELLEEERPHVAALSKMWRLPTRAPRPLSEGSFLRHSNHPTTVRECPKLAHSRAEDEQMRHAHDAFRWKGGKTISQIWQILNRTERPLSEAEIASSTGRKKRTVKKALAKMRALGLAVQKGREWLAAKDASLDAVAAKLGTTGKAAKQKLRHAVERRRHQEGLQRGSIV